MSGEPVVVFAGPSLDRDDRRRDGFDWRGPAQAGDLIALIERPPERLCLIDGLFDRCAAPWHKELLLLIAAGTRVFGAASMGALRAAELDGLGMIGVGAIYDAYRAGRLTGDDEVALIHGPERIGWAPLSVPMVEVRATLARACRQGTIGVAAARRLRAAAHAIHYADRDWPAIATACSGLASAGQLAALAAMHVRLKRRDALLCLDVARRESLPPTRAAMPPVTGFIRRLARESGVEPALERALDRARRTDAGRPRP